MTFMFAGWYALGAAPRRQARHALEDVSGRAATRVLPPRVAATPLMARTRQHVPVWGCHRLPTAPYRTRFVKSAEPPKTVAGFDPPVGLLLTSPLVRLVGPLPSYLALEGLSSCPAPNACTATTTASGRTTR